MVSEVDGGQSPKSEASPFSNPDVIYFLVGRFAWYAASQINNVAVGWIVYDVTRSAWGLGLVGLAAFAPKVVVSFISGLVADRYDRRKITAVCLVVSGVCSVGLVAVSVAQPVPIGMIYLLYTVNGVARGFAGPANQALAANIVSRQQLSRVISMSSSVGKTATILGPALGGFLFIGGAWLPFAVAAVFFFIGAALALMIKARAESLSKSPATLADAFAGLVFIWRRPVILGAISLDMFCVFLGGATALLPIVAADILHVGPVGLGILRSMPALGAVMVGTYLAYWPIERRVGYLLFLATTVFGLATIGLGLSTTMYVSLAFLWLIGASDVVSVVIRHTMVQSDTPDEMRGRVAAVNTLFIGASNELGDFESGATAALFGTVPAIIVGGAGTILVSVLWAAMFPQLRQRDRLV